VDAGTTVNYDISFGGDTAVTAINIPDARGNLQFDSSICATPPFQPAKPFFQVYYNSIPRTHPMTMSPLFTTGTMCIHSFFKNTTGVEGIKRFQFEFNPLGYSSVIAPAIIPGNYNPGNWILDNNGYNASYTFVDSAGLGRGDFNGSPNTCLAYEFCFDVVPVSNSPLLTDVNILAISDNYGAGFSGTVTNGCCPSLNLNCLPVFGGGSGGSGASSFGFGFGDPGSALPIELIDFSAKAVGDKVHVTWITGTEINNDYFTIQKSKDGKDWIAAGRAAGAGNSTSILYYEFTDENPLPGASYYRLKQTDLDGHISWSDSAEVFVGWQDDVLIYPNPATNLLTVQSASGDPVRFYFYNVMGEKIQVPFVIQSNQKRFDTSQLPAGIYFLVIEKNNLIIKKEKIIIQN